MKDLYTQLMALCDNEDTPFFFSDQSCGARDQMDHYRIFSYHFTDKDSWLLPSALESRGIMFEVTEAGEFIRIACRPMQKFFNHSSTSGEGEVDFINYGIPEYVMNKADGSLISSYTTSDGSVRLKSKASLQSDHAVLAMELLHTDPVLYEYVETAEDHGFTVNMELVSPDPKFRIVLHYVETKLIILNVRHRESGVYVDSSTIPQEYFVNTCDLDVLNHLDTVTHVEGYVVIDEHSNWWKEKCRWYLERHRAKDFINQPLAFVELVLKEEADDVFALIADQPEVLAEMQALQHKVVKYSNTLVNSVTAYYKENRIENDLTRKDYAIKGKEELSHFEFVLAMQYYDGKEPDWKKQLLQWVKKIDWVEEDVNTFTE